MRLGLFCALLLVACGPTQGSGGDDTTGEDADGDGISDKDEGTVDTDNDGKPDYLDTDSDNDGITDAIEAGDKDLMTPPYDSDTDGTPDFRDEDSDNNGRPDKIEGADDPDQDTLGNYADIDDDGDNIYDVDEIGPNPLAPVDTDGDGTADFHDIDSDDDTIPDSIESNADYDNDGIGNFQDLDSDGDCISDMAESRGIPPADSDGDTRADYLDRDSDNDGLGDMAEDANCSGSRDGAESSATDDDTDNDGVTDLVESVAGTDPNNAASNPKANGDYVFVEPYMKPQMPTEDNLDFSSKLQAVDLYVELDRSGSMATEITAVKNNLATVVNQVACSPLGSGTPPNCIPDLWAGAATVGYKTSEGFTHWVDIQPNPSFSNIITTEPPIVGNTQEPLTYATYAALTAFGGSGYSISGAPGRGSCNGSPANNANYVGHGYPCFRLGALPVVLLATDEPPLSAGDTWKTPDWDTVVKPQFQQDKARVIGILGDNITAGTDTDLRKMATDTNAIDVTNGNAPLVFNGSGANAPNAIKAGILALANGLPLDVNAVTSDVGGDAVDAVASFVHHIETLQLGTATCANGLNDIDTNSDTYKDKYVQIRTGTPICWKVVSKQNTTVPATQNPQLFRATITVYGDGITQLDQRDVYFLVPPVPLDNPLN
jgi:hypothetical protein